MGHMSESALMELPETRTKLVLPFGSDDFDLIPTFSKEGRLYSPLPFRRREEIKDYSLLGESSFVFGNGVWFWTGLLKARIPPANAFLSLEQKDLTTGELYDLREDNWRRNMPWTKTGTYEHKALFYKIDDEVVRRYREEWARFHARRAREKRERWELN